MLVMLATLVWLVERLPDLGKGKCGKGKVLRDTETDAWKD